MKKLEMLPTEENIIDCLYNDTIGRNEDVVNFYRLLLMQESSGSIAIDGRWGSGKTFFVSQMKMVINAFNSNSSMDDKERGKVKERLPLTKEEKLNYNSCIAVYYDAWKNDNDTEPILSIIYEITKQLSVDFALKEPRFFQAAGALVGAVSGRDIMGIKEALKSEDPYESLKKQKSIDEKINSFFSSLLEERANRLVIFIDELDRCRPKFAVDLLEQIKHYITDDRITFVFSVNIEQLQHTIKHYYGLEFDSCRYLDRFFDLRISIPPANLDKFYCQIGLDSLSYVDSVMKKVIKMFNFELREITKLYAQVRAAVYKLTQDRNRQGWGLPDEEGEQIIMSCIIPLMIGLKIFNINQYDEFVNGRNNKPLKELFNMDSSEWLLANLLDEGESFVNTAGKKCVTKDEIIERFYDAIFVNQYVGNKYNVIIGKCEFTKESKDFAIRISSMLSRYADFS